MYGASGERRLTELTLDWLPGYEQSRPVRIGNAAVDQLQLDVYGEVMDALYVALRAGVEPDQQAWSMLALLIEFLATAWKEPDEGIWEVRGPRRHFTHSKVMAWVAFDRAIKMADELRLRRTDRAVVRRARRNPCGRVHARLQRRAQRVHAVLRRDRARRQPAAGSAGRASCHPRIRG